MKYFPAMLILLPAIAHSQTTITRDEFENRINRAAADQNYRDGLLRSDELDTLLFAPSSASEGKKNINSKDPAKGPNGGIGGSSESGSNDTGNGAGQPHQPPGTGSEGGSPDPGSSSNNANASAGLTPSPEAKAAGEKEVEAKSQEEAKAATEKKAVEAKAAAARAKNKSSILGTNSESHTSSSEKNTGDYYFPSGMSVEKKSTISPVAFTFDENRTVFGISLGTSIPVRLRRTSTNVQPGYIELVVTADVAGRKKTLPADSILFAISSVVKGSSRLYLNSVKGVTPGGEEFVLKGHISDHFNTAGLSGVIKSDGRAVSRSLSQGGLALSRSLASEIGGDALATGANAVASQLIQEGSEKTSANLDRAAFIVSANPQQGVLTVEETF